MKHVQAQASRIVALTLAALMSALLCGASVALGAPASTSASTTVYVTTEDTPAPDPTPLPLEILGVSEDIAGAQDEVRTLTLEVRAQGAGELKYQWSRSANGQNDTSFSHNERTCSLSDVQADTTYTYTVEVSDDTAETVSATVLVRVSATEDEYTTERIEYPGLGVNIEANLHKDARLEVIAQPVGTEGFSDLLKSANGKLLRPPAYRVRLTSAPASMPAFVGPVKISVPSPGAGVSVLPKAYADDTLGVPVEVLLISGQGSSHWISGREVSGLVVFETENLGTFAAAGSTSVEPGPGEDNPPVDPDTGNDDPLDVLPGTSPGTSAPSGGWGAKLLTTGDGATTTTLVFVLVAALSTAVLACARLYKHCCKGR